MLLALPRSSGVLTTLTGQCGGDVRAPRLTAFAIRNGQRVLQAVRGTRSDGPHAGASRLRKICLTGSHGGFYKATRAQGKAATATTCADTAEERFAANSCSADRMLMV